MNNNIELAQMHIILNRYPIDIGISYTTISHKLPHIDAKLKRTLATKLDREYVDIKVYKHKRIVYTKLKDLPEHLITIPLETTKEIVLWGLSKCKRVISLRDLVQYTRVLTHEQRIEALEALAKEEKILKITIKPTLYRLA